MRTIFKYKLEVLSHQTIIMPLKAKVLCVQNQNETPCVWALVDSNERRTEPRQFITSGTGNEVENDCTEYNYIGTYQLQDGRLVFHVFEVD